MIIGMKPSILEALNELPDKFILTGSRYFGGYNHESDYDFFCQHSHELCNKLYDLGFRDEEIRNLEDVSYTDRNCVQVYKHITEPIHIQLVKDFELKVKAQDFLKGFPFSAFNKKERKHVWNWAVLQVK